jgi:hypothetical protein
MALKIMLISDGYSRFRPTTNWVEPQEAATRHLTTHTRRVGAAVSPRNGPT